jgi:hypothetical protein
VSNANERGNPVFQKSQEKMTLIFVFWQGFLRPDGIKYGAKNSPI